MTAWPSVAVVDVSVSTANYIFTKRGWDFVDNFQAFMNRISLGLTLRPSVLRTEEIWTSSGYNGGQSGASF